MQRIVQQMLSQVLAYCSVIFRRFYLDWESTVVYVKVAYDDVQLAAPVSLPVRT